MQIEKFERLPLHFIDTNVIVEALTDTKLGTICSDYLNRVGYKYRGILPLSVLGEFFLITFRDIEETSIRELGFRFIERFIERNKIGFSSLKYESLEIIDKIKGIDARIDDTDAIHLANCIQDKGNTFVTFDEKFFRSIKLEKEFSIRIIHPRNL